MGAPNIEEIILSLNLESCLVGVGKTTGHPDLPRIANLQVFTEKLINVKPTHLFILESQNTTHLQSIARRFGFKIESFTFNTLRDIEHCYEQISESLGLSRYAPFQPDLPNSNNTHKDSVKGIYVIWWQPIMLSGQRQFISELLESAGIYNAYPGEKPYPVLSLETLLTYDLQVILYSDEAGPPPTLVKKFLTVDMIPVDADLFSRPGPSLVKAKARIEEIMVSIQ